MNKELRKSIFSPNMGSEAGQDFAHSMRESSAIAIPLYLDSLDKAAPDKRFTPMRGGWMYSFLALNSNGKTSWAIWHAIQRANWLVANKLENRAILFVSAEVMVETLHAQMVACSTGVPYASVLSGDLEPEQIKTFDDFSIQKMPGLPIWLAGHSATRHIKNLRISDAYIDGAASEIESWGPHQKFEMDIIYVDYLQKLSLENRKDLSRNAGKAEMVSQLCHNIKDIALDHNCVTWLNTQAGRDVEKDKNEPDKMPGSADSQWSSDLEHDTDILCAAWKTSRYHNIGASINVMGKTITVNDKQWLFKVHKHRFGPASMKVEVYYDAAIAKFGSMAHP